MARSGGKKRKAIPGPGIGAGAGVTNRPAGDGGGAGGAQPAAGGGAEAKAEPEAPPAKAAKSATEFRAPDAAEVLEISRTQNLYKSNLFRLQLEELVREIAPRKAQPQLEAFLRQLKDLLEGLKPRKVPEDFASAFPELHFQKAREPFPFDFAAPKRIDVVGSFLLGTGSRAEAGADVALEMPSSSFQSKDYLNFRYLDKRAAYVGELHRQLAALCGAAKPGSPLEGVEAEVEPLLGDHFRPCVVLRPSAAASGAGNGASGSGGGARHWVVRLLPAYAADLFPIAKLMPDRNLVRSVGAGATGESSLPPTALYNSCVLEDSRMRSHLELLHKAHQRTPALRDAVLLLKRWAMARSLLQPQRALRRGVAAATTGVFTPLSGFCLSVLAAHAAQTSSMAPSQTSSYQLFKLALSVLASTEWATHKLTFGKAVGTPLSEAEAKVGGAHFYDADGAYNFFWRLGPFLPELRWEAQRALRILDAESDPFEAVFGQEASSPALLWDLSVRTPPLSASALCPATSGVGGAARAAPKLEFPGAEAPADAPEALLLAQRMAQVLAEGLGDRCVRAVARLVANGAGAGGVAVVVGLQLEPIHLERALDRGPSAESEEAQRFRELWGSDKSELRRFKDGSVLECAVWAKPPAGRGVESRRQPAVVTQIVRHLLKRHFPEVALGTDIVSGATGFVTNLGDRERRLWVALEAFRAHLCQLSSLPLTIKDVHPMDPSFSYTELVPRSAPPTSDGFARTLHDTVVEFESSGRWPDDPMAARKVAGAMLLQMKEELQSDLGIESDVAEGFLDVRYPEFVFRIQIFHEHELVDVAHRVTNFQTPPGMSLPGADSIERLRTLWWRPRVRSALHAHVLQKPALAGAARLCQRWLSTQLLAGYEEFAEHLVAGVFLTPSPFDTPTSPQVGLCRVCWVLDTFDWEKEPYIVDFDGKLAAEERLAIRQSFERSRSEGSSSSSFWISSRFDPHAILLQSPPATVATWLRRRARHALAACHQRLLGLGAAPSSRSGGGGGSGWDALFALDTSIFDLVVNMRPLEASSEEKKGAKGERLKAAAAREAVASLVGKLRAHLSPVCLVFHDSDSRVVALKWRPSAFFPQHQNVLMGAIPHTMIPQDKGKPPLCVPNVLYLTSAVASLAEGLALDLQVKAGGGLGLGAGGAGAR